jgi:WD40 repeat protein
LGYTDWVRDIAFAPDGKTLASGGHRGQLLVMDEDAKIQLNDKDAKL